MQKAAIDQGVKLSPDEKATQRFETKKQALIDAVIVGNTDAVQNAICNERDFEKRFRLVEALAGFLDMLQMAWAYDNWNTRSLDDVVQELNTQFAQHFAPDEATEARKQRSVDSIKSIYRAAADTMAEYLRREPDVMPRPAAYVQFDIKPKKDCADCLSACKDAITRNCKIDLSQHAYIIDVSKAAVLYFFVSHRRSFNPARRNSVPASGDQVQPDDKPKELLTDEFKQEIISTFEALTTIYTNSERKPADELELVEWFCNAQKASTARLPEAAHVEDMEKYPHCLDPANENMWGNDLFTSGKPVNIYSGAEKKTGQEGSISVTIDYSQLDKEADKLGIRALKELPMQHKKIYAIAGALYLYASERGLDPVFSLQDFATLAKMYGNSSIDTIRKILLELQRIVITVDNELEIKAGFKYNGFRYYGYLLPFEMVAGLTNGVESQNLVHLLREPPLQQFARERKQFEWQPLWMLQTAAHSYLATSSAYTVQDCLTSRISHWERSCRDLIRKIDRLQKKSRKTQLTIKEQILLEQLQKKLSEPLIIVKKTVHDKLPQPSTDEAAADDDHERTPEELQRAEQKRQERLKAAIRQRNTRADKEARLFLETCVQNGKFGRFEEEKKRFLLYR